MDVSNWIVMADKDTGKHICYYVDMDYMDDFEKEFGEPYDETRVIPYEDWNTEDIVSILTSCMEDANMHRYLYWPNMVLDTLVANNIDETIQKNVMRDIFENMLSHHINKD